MDEPLKKRVDESWKEQAERERQLPKQAPAASSSTKASPQVEPQSEAQQPPEARFDLFISGLAMETLVALGDMPHPITRKQAAHLPHARYLIDLLGILEQKTRGNLSVEEDGFFKDTLYQLRMRYMNKTK